MFYNMTFYYTFVSLNVKYQIMKKVIKNIKKGTLLVAMCATMLSNASESETPPLILNSDGSGTSLTIKNVKEGNLLSIVDDNGIILYKETIEKSGVYTKGFDLTALPDGNYFWAIFGVDFVGIIN